MSYVNTLLNDNNVDGFGVSIKYPPLVVVFVYDRLIKASTVAQVNLLCVRVCGFVQCKVIARR